MNVTHRRRPHRRAAAWRTLSVVAALGAVTTLTAVPAPGLAQAHPGIEGVVLSGPTGTRSGVEIDDVTAPPDVATIAPLDTYGREPALTIADMDGGSWSLWEVTAVPAADPGADPIPLATGVAEVPLDAITLDPPDPGAWLVVASLQGDPSGSWAWHLVIPDRSLPEFLPAPDIVLFGGGITVIAERGSGCYLNQCGDIGQAPPDRTLPVITLSRPDEPITLTLSDGSGIVRASVQAVPLDADAPEPVLLGDRRPFPATNVILVPPPPSVGRWRLEIQVTFSDGRGDLAGYARVRVP